MIIENCPSCGSKLVYVKDQLYCKNSANCPAQNSKAVEHFCKTMKIKGFGPKRIETLELSSIHELYSLTEEIIAEKLGAKTASNLIAELDKARNPDFATFLAGCGVPLIGNAAASKLAKVVSSFEDITASACSEAGLGAKATENLMNFISKGFLMPDGVVFNEKIEQSTQKEQKTDCIEVCISGKITGYTKAQAEVLLNEIGYVVKPNITQNVEILITELTETAKYKAAQKMGLPIGTLQEVLAGTVKPNLIIDDILFNPHWRI